MERGQAVLPSAEKVARAALRQIRTGDFEAVVRLAEDFQPFAGGRALVRAEKDAVGLPRAASDTAAKLMQLRQTEAVRVLDRKSVV